MFPIYTLRTNAIFQPSVRLSKPFIWMMYTLWVQRPTILGSHLHVIAGKFRMPCLSKRETWTAASRISSGRRLSKTLCTWDSCTQSVVLSSHHEPRARTEAFGATLVTIHPLAYTYSHHHIHWESIPAGILIVGHYG